jgi:hypothetical protein
MLTIGANAMHSLISKRILACFVLLLASRACADEARAVLERAIQAHGGADKLERTKRGRLKATVTGRRFGGVIQLAWEETFDLPGRFHSIAEGTAGGKGYFEEQIMDGARGWTRLGKAPPVPVTMPKAEPLEWHWHAILAQLVLLSSKDTELKLLGEQVKDGRRLVAISASSPRAAADLYFDRATGLLARRTSPMPNFDATKEKPIDFGEFVYDEYKEVQGVQYPMQSKATSTGSSLEIKIASIEFLDKIDELAFAKPVEAGVAEAPSSPEEPAAPGPETSARWDRRLVVATLAVGSFVALVWFLIRGSRMKKQQAPQ